MPCYHPLKGYRSAYVNPKSGKRSIVFSRQEAFSDLVVEFACGQCIGCRLDRSRQWATRCFHEASLYSDNCFVTLTYSDEFLPADRSLCLKHFQDFMKRLRELARRNRKFKKSCRKIYGKDFLKVRFFHCGEYGERFGRPHYHVCLFNFDFPDKVFFSESNGSRVFTSKYLAKLWPFGHCLIGSVTWESAAYVARYVTKKVTGDKASEHYTVMDELGNFHLVRPEYTTMSRRPGIGAGWFARFGNSDVIPHDNVVVRGKVLKVPKFYDRIFEVEYPSDFERMKRSRKTKALARADDNTPERLEVKESLQLQKLDKLKRGYEHG